MSDDKMAHEIKPGDTLAWTLTAPEVVERVEVDPSSGLTRIYTVGRRIPFALAYRELVPVEGVRS